MLNRKITHSVVFAVFASSSERKEEPSNSIDAIREPSPKDSKSSLHQQQPDNSKPYSPAAVVRASAISPPGSSGDSPGASPEGRRRVFGRFSSKRQRSGKWGQPFRSTGQWPHHLPDRRGAWFRKRQEHQEDRGKAQPRSSGQMHKLMCSEKRGTDLP